MIPAGAEVCPVCALRGALDKERETVELKMLARLLLCPRYDSIITRSLPGKMELRLSWVAVRWG